MVLQTGGVFVLQVFSLFAACRLVVAAWEELKGTRSIAYVLVLL